MLNRFKPFLAACLGLAAAFAVAPAQAADGDALTDAQRQQVEQVIENYLLENPEIIARAIERLQDKQREAEAQAQKDALKTHQDALFANPDMPVAGNPDGDVTIVEFFDFKCPYCHHAYTDLMKLIAGDDKLKVVFVDFPILGPSSVLASRAALAAQQQGKYMEMHKAIFATKGPLNQENLFAIAAEAGLDTDRLKADMGSRAVDEALARNLKIARDLQLTGTPAFIAGGEVFGGAVPLEHLQAIVEAVRKGDLAAGE